MTSHRSTSISFHIGSTLIAPYHEAPPIVSTVLNALGVTRAGPTVQAAYRCAERVDITDELRPRNATRTADLGIECVYTRSDCNC
jgi:hypothetical protein